jgi:hypothetical protein
MKLRIAGIGVLPSSLALAALGATFVLHAQVADPPPVKMGLWQTEVNTTMVGMPNMPAGHASGDHKTVTQGCMTPETWKDNFQKFNQRQNDADCKTTNLHQDAHGISLDQSCNSNGFQTDMHFEGIFDGDNQMHGNAKMKMTGPAFPQGMTMNMTMTSKYLSSDCGDVQPGHAKVIH